jgi:hypothetical protein
VPISQKRMSAIERELAVIVRELDRIERARVNGLNSRRRSSLGTAAVAGSG